MTNLPARASRSKTCLLGVLCIVLALLAIPHRAFAAPSGSYSVGGVASGLSGSVVVQDNGSDDVTVSASGSFTFDSLLAGGAAYDVTVAQDPAGQVCTVADGSGTVATADVTNVAVSCTSASATTASDNFDRANGSLGPAWTDMSGGGLVISSDAAVGTNAGGNSGEIRTGESYSGDQFSQVTLTSAQLTGTEWIGPAVRAQDGGMTAYVGFYFWNSGSPELMLFERNQGNWNQLGSTVSTAPLQGGTQLGLTVVGNSLSFTENGTQVIGVSNSTLTGGSPGIIANGLAQVASWAGGDAGFQVSYQGAANGISTYSVLSDNNGYGPQVIRVLPPTNPAPGVAHNFLIVLPVEPGLGSTYGDGLETVQALDAQDQYNLTVIEPTFAKAPWYANNPDDPNIQYETFMTQELVPWIRQNLANTGNEQIWLLGFSKSGLGAQDLILKYPNLFTLAGSWDFPANASSYDEYSDSAGIYGTEANFQANYELTPAFVQAHAAPFLSANRIWIGSYSLYQTDVSDYDALLTSTGIDHTTETPQEMAHLWTSGWVPIALAALYHDSLNLPTS
jgi:hypothetical protein